MGTEIIECPHCCTHVTPMTDGTCPACRKNTQEEPARGKHQELVWAKYKDKAITLLNLLSSPYGRINRTHYWALTLVVVFSWFVAVEILAHTMIDQIIISLVLLWPAFAIQAKRWHDIDLSGWWSLIYLIGCLFPLATILVFIVLGVCPGTEGENRFGNDPNRRQNGNAPL